MGDHTETLQIDYDPEQVTYDELVDLFWESHNPKFNSRSKQYMNILFYHDEEQEQLARDTKESLEQKLGSQVRTEIQPFTNFYLAEDYHQKYYLKFNQQLIDELQCDRMSFQEFADSTIAARFNGYAGGYGDRASLEKDIETYGLSEKTANWLRARVRD